MIVCELLSVICIPVLVLRWRKLQISRMNQMQLKSHLLNHCEPKSLYILPRLQTLNKMSIMNTT